MAQEKIRDIHERIYQFILRVLKLVKELPRTPENLVIIYQLTKSVTSMGANDQEADGCETRKDFIAKYSIVKKENKETLYWLRLISDTNPTLTPKILELIPEGKEILNIVSAIIIKTKNSEH